MMDAEGANFKKPFWVWGNSKDNQIGKQKSRNSKIESNHHRFERDPFGQCSPLEAKIQ